jgi:predicted  nucleic acid-binding Zn-ribbon protein
MDNTEIPSKVLLTKRRKKPKTHEEQMMKYYSDPEKQENLKKRIKKYENMIDDLNKKLADLRQFLDADKRN